MAPTVVPGTIIRIPRPGANPRQDPDLRMELAQLGQKRRPQDQRSSCDQQAVIGLVNEAGPAETHRQVTKLAQTKELKTTKGKSSKIQLAEPCTKLICFADHSSVVPTHGKTAEEKCSTVTQKHVDTDLQDPAAAVPEFLAQLDSRVYTSLAEAQQLLLQQQQQQSSLSNQLPEQLEAWPSKDDISFSSIAADILTSFSL